MSSPPSFLLPQTLWHELPFLFSCSIRLQWVLGHSFCFSRRTTRLMSWPVGERYLRPCSLLSLVSTLLFSWTGGAPFHRNSSILRFPRFPPRNLCSLVMLPVLSLVYVATDTACCSCLFRIGRIENPSCSACGHSSQDTSHLILHCPATDSAPLTLWRLSVSLRPLVQTLGSFPASWAPWSSAMPPSLERGRVTTTTASATVSMEPLYIPCILFSVSHLPGNRLFCFCNHAFGHALLLFIT